MPSVDVVVIGAGLAGLSCAAELAERGARVLLVAKGMATTHWTHGGLDVGAVRGAATPRESVARLARDLRHPYASLAADLEPAVAGHLDRLAGTGLHHVGSIDAPFSAVPTAIGTLRPSAILPFAQAAAGEPWGGDGLLLVGFDRYRDSWAPYAARNLADLDWPSGPGELRAAVIELPGLDRLNNLNAVTLGHLFDDAAWRARALKSIGAVVPRGAWRIGLPAVFGIARHAETHREAESVLGRRAFEVPGLPPSIPGMRLFEALQRVILAAGGRVHVGFDVVRVERSGRRVTAIHTDAAARTLRIAAETFVLATGGLAGAGFRARRDGTIEERVFGLAVTAPERGRWFDDDPLAAHPLEAAGIVVNEELAPPELENVRVIGSALAGMHYLGERCGDGVALASAHRVARNRARAAAVA